MDPLQAIISKAYKVTKELADKAPKDGQGELSYLEGLLESAMAIITPEDNAEPRKGWFK